ncbi:HAD family hydrolase [Xylanibacter caecicola]|uniref:HAD family hydrolase n=1 Tax=Xylanibacter caecicola TaxID=2736294 RepID=UPI00258F1837|nr:HAD family phosphatase [Xylanibacter caecicola]
MEKFKAALFDLDGVVFDTEPQYTLFWGSQFRKYYPETEGLEHKIKGQTLVWIYDTYFKDMPKTQADITAALDEFEKNMEFEYVKGFADFVKSLRRNGVRTAVVTSSNRVKMQNVYGKRPEMKELFDEILTSEDFKESKPSPECYLTAAGKFAAGSDECVVFEDSFNGLKSGRAAEMSVVGLATTNGKDDILPLADVVIDNYEGMDYEKIYALIFASH